MDKQLAQLEVLVHQQNLAAIRKKDNVLCQACKVSCNLGVWFDGKEMQVCPNTKYICPYCHKLIPTIDYCANCKITLEPKFPLHLPLFTWKELRAYICEESNANSVLINQAVDKQAWAHRNLTKPVPRQKTVMQKELYSLFQHRSLYKD